MQNKEFYFWFTDYQQQAQILNERRLIVLVGDNVWASNLIASIDMNGCKGEQHKPKNWLVYGDNNTIKSTVSKQRFRDKLGSESHFVVFQDRSLSIDAFAVLSGTLVAGGIFFLLIDNIAQMSGSLFYQRFLKRLQAFKQHIVIDQHQSSLPSLPVTNAKIAEEETRTQLPYNCLTQEQVTAVDAVIKVVKGKRNQPLVLTADRGRGKSSALAIACGQLLNAATKDNKLRIAVTAVDRTSLSIFFRQLATSVPRGQLEHSKFCTESGLVEYIPIDQLLKEKHTVNLVLVDEASAIPIYLLEALLDSYSRLVFASTIHGYEGAGRGFTLKFQKTLAMKYPHWRSMHVNEPIRWRVNDPLEKLVFESCLLNAELTTLPEDVKQKQLNTLVFKQFSAVELVTDENLLKEIFAILVTAHYQTKPSDVKMLLDNEQVKLVCLFANQYKRSDEGTITEQILSRHVVAVALLIVEGSTRDSIIETSLINAVNHGHKRLKNHFVPQSLLTQCGIDQAFNYHYMRVMRIAVHPQVQQQGMGSYFLSKISDFSTAQGADFLASSFGATKSLLSFWLKNDFRIARIGFTKDKASGEQSSLMLKALTTSGEAELTDIVSEFYRSFDYLLTEEYKPLSAGLVLLILSYCPISACSVLSVRDKANIVAFAEGYRQYSSCVFSLHLWLKQQLSGLFIIDEQKFMVLISRIMQKNTVVDVCKTYGVTGKKELEQLLRSKVRQLL